MLDGIDGIDGAMDAEMAASYQVEWMAVHAKLRELAHRRVALEAEESTYLLEAEDLHVFKRVGYRSMIEYMVGELDYTRHAANERLRVSRELVALPKLAAAFNSGELCFSKVRELSRVVTPATEEAFVVAARGKDSHEVAKMVSGLKRGDLPDARPDPALVTKRVVFELHAEALSMLSLRTKALKALLGREPTHDEVIIALCTGSYESSSDKPGPRVGDPASRAIGPTGDRDADAEACAGDRSNGVSPAGEQPGVGRATSEETTANQVLVPEQEVGLDSPPPTQLRIPRPSSQQLLLTCKHCVHSELVVDGESLAIDFATAERLLCDVELIGDAESDERTRVRSKIPAALRRKAFRRDRGRCVVPGCTAREYIQCHHLEHQEHGGQHTMSNLCCLCFFHHKQHHGILDITGTAPYRLEFRWRSDDDDEPGLPAN